MKSLVLSLCAAIVLVGCQHECVNPVRELAAVSPDGRNEIRLFADPLAFEVKRDGRTVVARTEIGLTLDGKDLRMTDRLPCGISSNLTGRLQTPVYKKTFINLAAGTAKLCFGDWGVEAVSRNDGVAYRFVVRRKGARIIDAERGGFTVPDASSRCWYTRTQWIAKEEKLPEASSAADVKADERMSVYPPFLYRAGDTVVAVTESDVRAYPVANYARADGAPEGGVRFGLFQSKFPKTTERRGRTQNMDAVKVESGGRWIKVMETEPYLAKAGQNLPWRVFALADRPADLMAADIVNALAAPAAEAKADFSWVKPGKVAWDWWNCFDNQGPSGCSTKTYLRFIDFAAKNHIEYVILDEGWSDGMDIWKFHRNVDVPKIIEYAAAKRVGIILWMAWAQAYGQEEKVAAHFAKLGAKGFKVDFIDRGDADALDFYQRFAAAAAKHRMLVDYHGAVRPTGLSVRYPNVLNYEGIYGLEQMKWFKIDPARMLANDVACCFQRMTAGPMDYTPGAMLNYPLEKGAYTNGEQSRFPGSVGTRVHQMAMMPMYEAYLQMLADSPTNYEKNRECLAFMAEVPVTWEMTVGLGGDPESYAAVARRTKDGIWYLAVINNAEPREIELDTAFLGKGEWLVEAFEDAPESDRSPTRYRHTTAPFVSGGKLKVRLAPGGGYVARILCNSVTK